MTKTERQRLIEAYNNFASVAPTLVKFGEGERLSRAINEEDFEALKPLFLAEYKREYEFPGGAGTKIEGNLSSYFVEVITNEGRNLLFENDRQEAEFFFMLVDMITAILSPIFDRVKSNLLNDYETEATE